MAPILCSPPAIAEMGHLARGLDHGPSRKDAPDTSLARLNGVQVVPAV